ncbi:aspartic peptidase domain-containing protein [Coniella lustricola]|uniref:Aspartic peptidase domain-containing protein n=1 Tax=Coniella lustricola TaxID=2025994 RepID=A0A2T3ANM3_9PEZI|nr:aspartic peptidase domain-containing protein [Coniella lustricola]
MKFSQLIPISLAFLRHQTQASPLLHPKSDSTITPNAHQSQGTATFNVPLTDWIKNGHTDLQWYATIAVGTPPQEFSVLIDTGSHALILPQNNCTTCSPSQHKFTPSASSTFSWSSLGEADPGFSTGGDTIPLAEPQGALCHWAIDNVSILGTTTQNSGHSHADSKTAPAFAFLLCDEEDSALTTQPGIDGVLGLGLYSANPASFQYALVAAGVLPQSGSSNVKNGVFSLYTPPGEVTGAQLTLGGVDESRLSDCADELVWVPLNQTLAASHSQWVADIPKIFINGKQLLAPATTSSPSTARTPYPPSLAQVLDSGTAAVFAPDNATAAALYAQISPKIYQIDAIGTWGCSCADMRAIVESGAEITFLLGADGGQQFNATIPSSVFNLGPYPGLNGICQAVVNNWQDGRVCYNWSLKGVGK